MARVGSNLSRIARALEQLAMRLSSVGAGSAEHRVFHGHVGLLLPGCTRGMSREAIALWDQALLALVYFHFVLRPPLLGCNAQGEQGLA